MKNWWKMLPLAIYPYGYLLWLILAVMGESLTEGNDFMAEQFAFLFGDRFVLTFIIYHILVLADVIYSIVCCVRGTWSVLECAKLNLFVKAIQIPAYIFHFLMGVIGFCMGIFGIGFLAFAICIDLLTIILTGLNSIGCAISLKKHQIFGGFGAVLFGIGSFVYCVDLVAAIVAVIQCGKNKKISCISSQHTI